MKVILLANFGSPSKLEECRTLYRNMFCDKHIIPLIYPLRKLISLRIAAKSYRSSWEKYQRIGGSPMTPFMNRLQVNIAKQYPDYTVACCYSYLPPYIPGTIKGLIEKGMSELTVLPLYPQYSDCTTGSIIDDVTSALRKSNVKTNIIESFHDHPAYLNYFADLLKSCVRKSPNAHYIFSAHSIPMPLVEKGDPYKHHVEVFSTGVAELAGTKNFKIGYQSQASKGQWLGPATKNLIDEHAQKCPGGEVILVPVSFSSENLETCYDLDHALVPYAKAKGLTASRMFIGGAEKFTPICAKIINDSLRSACHILSM